MVDDSNDFISARFLFDHYLGPKHAVRAFYLYYLLVAQTLKTIWDWWQRTGLVIGNIISGVVLFVFYYTVFAVFAAPFRFFSKPFSAGSDSNFRLPKKQFSSLEDFKKEF